MNDKVRGKKRLISIWRDSIRTKPREYLLWGYGLAIISTVIALLASYLLQHFVFRTPLFFLAIMITVWIVGTEPGLPAVAMATLFINFAFSPDSILPTNFQSTSNIFAFLLTALLVCWWSLRRREAEQALSEARAELETRVQERTAHLRQANHQLQQELREREPAEASLRERETTYHAIFEAVHDILLRMDNSGNILDINRRAEEILGYSQSELRGMNVFEQLYVAEDIPHMRQVLQDLEKGQNREYTVRWKAQDGKIRYFEGASRPYHAPNGEFISTICTYRDITERKKADEALNRYTKRLEILHEIDEGILMAQSLEEIANTVLSRVTTLVPCLGAALILFDFEARQERVYTAQTRPESRFLSNTPISFDISEQLDNLQQGQAIIVDDLRTLPTYPVIQNAIEDGMLSLVIVPLLAHGKPLGVFQLVDGQIGRFSAEDVSIIRELANSLAIAIAQMQLIENVNEKKERLRLLTQQLIQAQETERRQIAQELHDRAGSHLTALSLNCNIIRNQLPPNLSISKDLYARLDDSQTLIENVIESIRDVNAKLSPLLLEDYGLEAALRSYAQHFAKRTGIEVEISMAGFIEDIAPKNRLAIYRIVQEVLTNIAKHAKASKVTITEEKVEQAIRLVISDNGIGFTPDAPVALAEPHGLGLLSIRDRAESIGAHLLLESTLGQGTSVIIEFRQGNDDDKSASGR